MKPVRAITVVEAPGIEAEQLWHDSSRWASWIDGFGHVIKLEGQWPLEGARRVWDTRPGGRGRVAERVLRYRAGDGQVLAVEDSRLAGELRVSFVTDNARTQITLEMDVEPKDRMPPARRWWLRRTLRESLRRTLVRFGYELAAER